MSTVVSERAIDCRADACSLWNVLTDTERLNRAVGMGPVQIEPLSNGTAARYLVTTSLGGFRVEYEERPFEWVYLRSFKVLRKMRSGPVESLETAFFLDEVPGERTTVTTRLTMVPRLSLLTPIIRFRASQALKRFVREIRRADDGIAGGLAKVTTPPRGVLREQALSRAASNLASSSRSQDITDWLVRLVREGTDVDLSRIRPYAVADEWGEDRLEVLIGCLHAVRAGLLELRWEIVCPSCRTATDSLPSLSALSDHGSCQLCEIGFAVDLDEAVEATFAPSPAVRVVDSGPYCIGGPARTPHVVAQVIMPPAAEARIAAPVEGGRYRLFVRGGASSLVEVAEGGPPEVRIDTEEVGSAEHIALGAGGAIVLVNRSQLERHAKLERATWTRQAATAREVTTLPEFRREFSSDTLRPGVALKVSRVALFFSDLTGSTELYSSIGDAAAFKLVQEHFDVVIAVLERHHGTLVKTIGDAVMGVFADEISGLLASLEVLRAFELFRNKDDSHRQTHIKLGLFGGPCYVVTANGILDYFGQTVNIAARLQGEAKGGELVVESRLADEAVIQKLLDPASITDRYEATLRGVGSPVVAARVRLH